VNPLRRVPEEGAIDTPSLADFAGRRGSWEIGDVHSAINTAGDGALWIARSDPRGDEGDRIVLARLR
jgi:hypothetical protein